jgi:hypothetical protein
LKLGLVSFTIGIGVYAYYQKILVEEPAKIKDYGNSFPEHKLEDWRIKQYLQRYKLLHIWPYRVNYYRTEQRIDPLNDDVLAPEVFEVYAKKRILRMIEYEEKRDNSFDFLQIGENDVEEFDDDL